MRDPQAIIDLYIARRRDYMELHMQMDRIRQIYKGEMEVPLPDMDRIENSYVPNLLANGVDQMAGRIASVAPNFSFPIEGKTDREKSTRKAERLANTRSRVVSGWWASDQGLIKSRKRARHLIAYSNSPTVVRYNEKKYMPCREVRHPMMTFPAPDLIPGVATPTDCIFAYTRTAGWLKANGYEDQAAQLTSPMADKDTAVTLIEYYDAEVEVLLGYAEPGVTSGQWYGDMGRHAVLQANVNPIGMVPVTVPCRIGLEEAGQFDGTVGMYYMQSKLMALELIGVEKGIFPDTWLEGRAGEVPKIVAGPFDGRTGEVNVVAGGSIKQFNDQPGYLTNGMIDRLERGQRITSNLPSEFGGESPTNVRTGRRGDAIMSATIDFPVAEAQDMIALAIHDEDQVAIALSRYYDGRAPRTIYVGTGNQRTSTTYIADDVFTEHCDHTVTYPISGTDLNTLMIGMGQRVGMGLMSKQSAAEMDPYIADAELEKDRIKAEAMEEALMSSLQQQAAAGVIPPLVLSRIMQLVKSDQVELAEAIEKATAEYAAAEARKAEAAAAAQAAPTDAAALGAEAGLPALTGSPIPGASPGQEDLATLMTALRKPAMTINPMQGAAQGAV